jgi:N6-L-threonylcarbamoyladenine synthase
MDKTNCKTCVIAGGVAANKRLRKFVKQKIKNEKVIFPKLSLCTDNAAMIAYLGELYLRRGYSSKIDFPVLPNMKLA